MIEPRKFHDWGSLRVCDSGDNTDVPNKCRKGARSGTNVRPGSESRAKQNWGLAGRWESLPFACAITGTGVTGLPTSLPLAVVVPAEETERARTLKVSIDEGDRAIEMNEGSLSLCIVALERRGTHPKDPLSSQGGGRSMGAYAGPMRGQQSHEKHINETIKHSETGWSNIQRIHNLRNRVH